MNRTRRTLLLISLLVILAYGLYFALSREHILRNGELVLLELAPVDPRSLLQGDYMDLRYTIGQDLMDQELPGAGYLILLPDSSGLMQRVRAEAELSALAPGEVPLTYRLRESSVWGGRLLVLGAESYFFEEGLADTFARARYGGLRLDGRGGSVLAGLYDADLRLIDPPH